MLDYNGKNFLAYGMVCPQKRHAKENKKLKKCITEIEKLTEYSNKKSGKHTHTHTHTQVLLSVVVLSDRR